MTVVEIEVGGEEQYRSLDGWLRGEDALRGRVAEAYAPPRPGEMGTPPRSLLVTLDADPAAAALARSLEVWFRLRGTEVTLRVRIGDRVAEFTGKGDVEVEGFVREVESLLRRALERR
ncbi:hypothetical protein HNP84_001710 [Thermocatellispora tengchongensis]|uniref:Uncharacterized protein n=1 Tax=Thermocatellispora tengchongensis TaxID=1073253 RepID=A0A840P431_9ACTN|nr:hypothetical protein [Thermocatellispora tengchongensis]MBB5131997.1 hypothetical protein [Thermocatellispora tengchongensis]